MMIRPKGRLTAVSCRQERNVHDVILVRCTCMTVQCLVPAEQALTRLKRMLCADVDSTIVLRCGTKESLGHLFSRASSAMSLLRM